MNLERYLDYVESLRKDRYFAFAIEYDGEIDRKTLQVAFYILYSHHPALRAKLRDDGCGCLIYVPRNHHPEFTVLVGDHEILQEELRYHIHRPNGTSRLILVEGNACGHVALQLNHAIFDGPAAEASLRELWTLYTALIDGSKISTMEARSLPRPPSEFMANIWNEIDLDMRNQVTSDEERGIISTQPRRPDSLPIKRIIRLDSELTDLLSRRSRELRLSMHAIVCGALTIALRQSMSTSASSTMTCYSTVDVRNKIVPTIGAMDTSQVAFISRATVKVTKTADIVDVSRAIKSLLNADISRRLSGNSNLTYDLTETDISADPRLIAHIGNAGAISDFPHPECLNFVELTLQSEVAIDPKIPTPHPEFTVYTYGGRLSIEGRFPADVFKASEVEDIVDRYRNDLQRLANSGEIPK